MRTAILIAVALAFAGCASSPQPTSRVIEVPSPKPYRFLKWSLSDTAKTRAAIRAHNRTHQAVINATKKASGTPRQ